MDLGSNICRTRNPMCAQCPLTEGCRARASGVPTQWPPKISKMAKKDCSGHVYVLFSNKDDPLGHVWMHPGVGGDLLSGLWRFPGSEWGDKLPDNPLSSQMVSGGVIHHVFTHINLKLYVWIGINPVFEGSLFPEWQTHGQWIALACMDQYPASTLMKKVLKQALCQPILAGHG